MKFLRNKILLFIVFQIAVKSFFAQSENFIFEKEVKLKADFFKVDVLENIYSVKNNVLTKHIASKNYEQMLIYSDFSQGAMSFVDVSNPFEILVYFSDFHSILFLDNFLNSQTPLYGYSDFENIEIQNVCSSAEHLFWAYDPYCEVFLLFDKLLNITHQTQSLRTLSQQDLTPIFMCESKNKLYVNTQEGELLVFDSFGTLERTVLLNIENTFQVNEVLSFFSAKEKKMFFYDFKSFEINEIDLSWKKNIIDAHKVQKKLYIFTPEGIEIYTHK